MADTFYTAAVEVCLAFSEAGDAYTPEQCITFHKRLHKAVFELYEAWDSDSHKEGTKVERP